MKPWWNIETKIDAVDTEGGREKNFWQTESCYSSCLLNIHMVRIILLWANIHTYTNTYCTIQINNQPDATIFQFIILTFIYSSTCFGRFPAHHQELNDCSGSLWFYLCIVVTVVLCSWSGRLAVRIINWKIVASGWWFIWIVQWCTDLKTLNILYTLWQDSIQAII